MSDISWLTKRPIAHRGYHDMNGQVWENTLSAFGRAIDGDYTIECDVHLTLDGEVVVFHDNDLRRLAGQEGFVWQKTAAEFGALKIGGTQDHAPTLKEMLDFVAGRVPIVIELKGIPGHDAGLVAKVGGVLKGYKGEVAIMSFDHWLIRDFSRYMPGVPAGLTAWGHQQQEIEAHFSMLAYGISFVSYSVEQLPNPFVSFVRDRLSMPVISWTVRDQAAVDHSFAHADQMTFEGFEPQGQACVKWPLPRRFRSAHNTAMMQRSTDGGDASGAGFAIRIAGSMDDFSRQEWESLAGTVRDSTPGSDYNPFLSFDFLHSLEQSGCAVARTGWQASHLRLEDENGTLLGAVPAYLKSHSQGEYVFDQGWADAFERAGGDYYPKLQVSVPFTPATGPRLLVRRDLDAAETRATLAAGLRAVTDKLKVSSAHVTFANDEDMAALAGAGYLRRTDQQFHFFNDNYLNYDDFLATLASRKRKALKKERREALAAGITIDRLTGSDLTEKAWDDFFAFYMDTGGRKWGRPYLNRRFFSLVGESMGKDVLLVMAKRAGKYVAGAINFIGSDTLYGRNWGCIEDHPFLHFEVCYHQAIDFAIERKLRVVEAGAQGEHKLARGYRPVTTQSAHYIAHPGLRNAVDDYLRRERREVARTAEYFEEHTPFRKENQQVEQE